MSRATAGVSRRVRPLTPLEMDRLRRQVARVVCSAPWFARCWGEVAGRRLRGGAAALDRGGVYPPGGRRRTRMRQCERCGVMWYPPQYVRAEGAETRCEDCAAGEGVALTDERTHVTSSSSATVMALPLLAFFRVRLVEPELPAEDERSLRREIAEFVNGAKSAKKHV